MNINAFLIASAIVLALVSGCMLMVDAANGEEPDKQGPTYILPRPDKSRHIVRMVCYWADGKLTCGPAIGTKWFKEKK